MNQLNSNPEIKQIYEGTRGEHFQIIYIDEQVVLLRSEQTHNRSERNVHRMETRNAFESQRDTGRLEHRPDADVEFPDMPEHLTKESVSKNDQDESDDAEKKPNASIDTFTADNDGAKDSIEETDEDNGESVNGTGSSGGDESENTDETTKIESGEEETESNVISESDTEVKKVDWSSVDTIGESTKDELHSDGFVIESDIRQADRDELKSVVGVGDVAVDNLKDKVS